MTRRRIVVGMLVLLVVAAGYAWTRSGADFDPAAFRTAAARDDVDAMEAQAGRAVADRALVGMRRDTARRVLGRPGWVDRRGRQWVWDLGMIGDVMGPGDDGAFFVRFDASWTRIVEAKLGPL